MGCVVWAFVVVWLCMLLSLLWLCTCCLELGVLWCGWVAVLLCYGWLLLHVFICDQWRGGLFDVGCCLLGLLLAVVCGC